MNVPTGGHDEHDRLRQGYDGPPKLHAEADGTMRLRPERGAKPPSESEH